MTNTNPHTGRMFEAVRRLGVGDSLAVLFAVLHLTGDAEQIKTTTIELERLTGMSKMGGHLKALQTAKLVRVTWGKRPDVVVHVKRSKCGPFLDVLTSSGPMTPAEPETVPNGAENAVLDYLNAQSGRSFRGSKNDRALIRGRFADGYTFEQMQKVIDLKVEQWGDDEKMARYIRPETLFRASKFDGYLNETTNAKPEQDIEEMFT